MKSLKGYVGRYIVLSLRQTVQLKFGYIIRLYKDGIPYCGGIKTWDFTAICHAEEQSPPGYPTSCARSGPSGSSPKSTQKSGFNLRPPFTVSTSTWSNMLPFLWRKAEEKKMLQSIISTSVNLERELRRDRSGIVAVEWKVYEEVEASRMAGYF